MNSITKRIIPCLDICDGRVVKGVNFVNLKDAGNPVEIAKKYNDEGADELCFLDITASHENRKTIITTVENVAKELFIPLTVGGGIRNIDDITALLDAGCDKVSLNSAAVKNPKLVEDCAKKFGSQCIVVAIDVKRINKNLHVFINGGRIDTKIDALKWAKTCMELGAGEILLTSMDYDGTKNGYDIQSLKELQRVVNIPIIASGGAGGMEDILEVFNAGADAALAASIFHFAEVKISNLKSYLNSNNIKVRI